MEENKSPYTSGGLLGDIDNPDHNFNFIRLKHGAFALQGFNVKRILQRPYFGMNTNKSDAEILDNFEVPSDLSIDELEKRLEKYTATRELLLRYGVRIMKHTDKLFKMIYGTVSPIENLATSPTQKISERENSLLIVYSWVQQCIGDLISKVADMIEKITAEIQQSYRKTFAQRLKQARKEKKISQRDLSDLTKINRADIGLYETGKKLPSLDNFIKISRCTGFSADWLLGMERI